MIRGYDLAGVIIILVTMLVMFFFFRWGFTVPLHVNIAQCIWKHDLGAAANCDQFTPRRIDEIIARFDRMDGDAKFNRKGERRWWLKESLRKYKKERFGD